MPATLVTTGALDRDTAPILSKVTLAPAARGAGTGDAAALGALEAAIREGHDGQYAALAAPEAGFLVASRWEPPFKLARAFSAKRTGIVVNVVADAFEREYWLARAVFENGRALVEETLTLADGAAFDALFERIHGESHAVWRTKHAQGAVRGGFSWGVAEHFDPAASELGKAEGQV